MKVLVLGSAGMLGHRVVEALASVAGCEVVGAVRGLSPAGRAWAARSATRIIEGCDAMRSETVAAHVVAERPDAVVNCIGIVKQRAEAADAIASIRVNSLFPHELARCCRDLGIRLVHFSTDCVFSGRAGPHTEEHLADPEDLYGRSKLLGELAGAGCTTLRTSIVGYELDHGAGLLQWFLAQRGRRVQGFSNALWSGLTTDALAALLADLLARNALPEGLWHVGGEPISKLSLLRLFNGVYDADVDIQADDRPAPDRRLDSSRFQAATGWRPAAWPEMIAAMRAAGGAR